MVVRFEELIERYHDEILSYAWRLLGSDGRHNGAMDAEDLVQDVFLRAYRNYSRLKPASNYRAWLYRIATNCAYTRLRKRRKERHAAAVESSQPTARTFPDQVESRSLRALIEQLPPKQRICLTLRYIQELGYPEIAQIVGCSEVNARAHVSHGLRRLRLAWRER